MQLAGRWALVTGGAVRLGKAIALSLADAGANIVLHYGHSETEAKALRDEINAKGMQCELIQADFSEPVAAAKTIFDSLEPSLQILINNAAIFDSPNLRETDEATYDRHQNINLKAPFFLCREFANRIGEQTPGAIINLCDWRALRPTGDQTAYTLTKAGLLALTKSLAIELAPNIRVNAIAPGFILPAANATAEEVAASLSQIPLDRQGDPEDITQAVLSILQNDYVTGEMIHVTGGQHL